MKRPMTPQSSPNNLILRMVARHAHSTWNVLPMKRGLDLYQGREPAPEWCNQLIEVVSVQIRTDMTPHRLDSAAKSVWRFDKRGMIDRKHVMDEIHLKLSAPKVDEKNDLASHLSMRDLEEICAVLRVQPPE